MNDIDEIINKSEVTLYALEGNSFDKLDEIKEINCRNEVKTIKIIQSELVFLKGLSDFKNISTLEFVKTYVEACKIILLEQIMELYFTVDTMESGLNLGLLKTLRRIILHYRKIFHTDSRK